MDKLSDFFKEIKDRASNPLIASFLISWMVVNWEIPIALLFYNFDELKADGYISYIKLIQQKVTTVSGVYLPLFMALFYTFGFTYIRIYISAYITYIRTLSTTKNLGISGTGRIATEKFIKLQAQTKELNDRYSDLINSESEIFTLNQQLQSQVTTLTHNDTLNKTQIESLKQSNIEETAKHSLSILEGYWNYKIYFQEISNEIRIYIKDDAIFQVSNDGSKKRIFTITNYFYNPVRKEITFMRFVGDESNFDIHWLKAEDFTEGYLSGLQNNQNRIEYRRTDIFPST
ncbi:hypothetical protein [Chitinophaga ginsengisegetis]|uniref:hypothetical protein n=1 Tax=Chitinophaga ginsengisegetis TaxID=393003 RepID=UPI000DBACC50|nr:hypothetical protein [Chitinophaga ginsengisegetis]MDR6565450.1 hypothetical protein [Chitinophaga ginsengisegetis]MDR6645178.1 hypothetical protein [Chitinophaga ginsengisegetis]MDR6652230.1 hypothetical protein [Chitinophaga ginsengisegetis]